MGQGPKVRDRDGTESTRFFPSRLFRKLKGANPSEFGPQLEAAFNSIENATEEEVVPLGDAHQIELPSGKKLNESTQT
jgi:hypothetical protein